MTNLGNDTPGVSALPWYGLRTRSNHEKVAATVLEGKGYQQFLPVYRSRRRWSDRIVETEKPLFPGYVFCRFDAKNRLPIVTTPGVISVVGFGNEPAPITEKEIASIQAIMESGLTAEPCSYLRDGQPVRVTRGPLTGVEGILVTRKSKWRMVVSVQMLQRSISVEVDREAIATL